MPTSRQSTGRAPGPLSLVAGETSRTRVLEYLVEQDGPRYQYEIAESLGVSQPSITRAKKPLVDLGVVHETDEGLVVVDGVDEALERLERAIL